MWNVKKSHQTCHAVEPSGLACTLDELLPLCAFVVHVLVIWKILFTELSDLLNADIFRSSITLMKIITNFIRKIFQYWEVVTLLVFQSSRFCLKA